MAKSFNQVITHLKETHYAKLDNVMTILASLNNTVQFTPNLKPNQIIGSTPQVQYNIQRRKRLKGSGDVAGTDKALLTTAEELAVLDKDKTFDWVTIPVGTGKLQQIGVKIGINEKFDYTDLGEAQQELLAETVDVEMELRHENLVSEIWDAKKSTVQDAMPRVPAFVKGDTKIRDVIAADRRDIQLLVDDFKHFSANQIIFINPLITDDIAKEIGTSFNNEAPIYKTGLKSKYNVNGVPVVEVPSFNKYELDEDTSHKKLRMGYVIMDIEALAFKADNINVDYETKLVATKHIGKLFYNIQKLVDADRTKVRVIESSTAVLSKKVNAA